MYFLSTQSKAARALLGWSQADLHEKSGGGLSTIRTFETGKSLPQKGTMLMLKNTFDEAGVQFIRKDESGGPGVRLVV